MKVRKAVSDVYDSDNDEASWMVDETARTSAAGSFADPMYLPGRKRALARTIGNQREPLIQHQNC